MSTEFIFRRFLLVFFTVMSIYGTIFTRNSKKIDENLTKGLDGKFELTPITSSSAVPKKLQDVKKTFLKKLMKGFAIPENFKTISSTQESRNSLSSLNGLRVIGSIWIITGHNYFYALAATDNEQLSYTYSDSKILELLLGAILVVDAFFVIGGFLTAYSFYEAEKKNPTQNYVIPTLKRIVTRYFRINPCFMIVRL